MSPENKRKAVTPRQPLNGQRVLRISGFRQNEIRKDLLRLATVNVGSLSERSKEVVDMFEKRRVDIRCLQEVRHRGQGTRVSEKRKSTSFVGVDQRRAEME